MRSPFIIALLCAVAACKPPPTDADIAAADAVAPEAPSKPILSPDTEGAVWADSRVAGRILYGIAGKPPLLALSCGDAGDQPTIRITRYARADEGAQAFAAFIGNGHVARIPVDASNIDGASVWFAEIPAFDPRLEVLTGAREIAVTLPGAGRLVLNPSHYPGQLIERCRSAPSV